MKKVSTAATKQSRNISGQKLTIGLDLGDRNSWYCVLDETGRIQLEQRVRTTAKGLQEVFGRPPLWVLVRFSQHRLPLFFAGLCGYFAYQTICTSVHGSTLGKRLLSLEVVQDDGSRCRLRSAIIRELAFFVDSFFFGVVGYATMAGNDQHKRYGDRWGRHNSPQDR